MIVERVSSSLERNLRTNVINVCRKCACPRRRPSAERGDWGCKFCECLQNGNSIVPRSRRMAGSSRSAFRHGWNHNSLFEHNSACTSCVGKRRRPQKRTRSLGSEAKQPKERLRGPVMTSHSVQEPTVQTSDHATPHQWEAVLAGSVGSGRRLEFATGPLPKRAQKTSTVPARPNHSDQNHY